MSGSIQFFHYQMRPKETYNGNIDSREIAHRKEEQLKRYESLYIDGFCKAYGIDSTNIDLRDFLYLVNKHIINRNRPEGVDFRPSKSKVRLYIAPSKDYMMLGVLSYDNDNNYSEEYKKFQKLVSRGKKHENLENKVNE